MMGISALIVLRETCPSQFSYTIPRDHLTDMWPEGACGQLVVWNVKAFVTYYAVVYRCVIRQ
jgi:hypothetical protein